VKIWRSDSTFQNGESAVNTFESHAYDLAADHGDVRMDLELIEMPAAMLAGCNGSASTVGTVGTATGCLGTVGTAACSGTGGGSAEDLSF
jgi:hypothetical protein